MNPLYLFWMNPLISSSTRTMSETDARDEADGDIMSELLQTRRQFAAHTKRVLDAVQSIQDELTPERKRQKGRCALGIRSGDRGRTNKKVKSRHFAVRIGPGAEEDEDFATDWIQLLYSS